MSEAINKLENFALIERVKGVNMLYKHIEKNVNNEVKDQIVDVRQSLVFALSTKVDQNPFSEKNDPELKSIFDNTTQAKNLVPHTYSGFKLWGNENNAARIELSKDDKGNKCYDIYQNEQDSASGALARREYTIKDAAKYSDKFTELFEGKPSNLVESDKNLWQNANNESIIIKGHEDGKDIFSVYGSYDNYSAGIVSNKSPTLIEAAKASNEFHKHLMVTQPKESAKEIER